MIRFFVVLAAAVVATAAPAAAEPLLSARVERGRVAIHAEEGLAAQARKLAPAAERHLDAIEADLAGLPRVDRVEVRLVRHQEDVAAVAPPGHGAPEWAAGTAYPDEGVVVVAARGRNGELYDMDKTLAHELAHLALARALGRERVPRWLTEGFAYLHSSDASFARAQTLFSAVIRGRVIPLLELERSFPAREDEVALAYAESYDFVAFLARRGSRQDDRDDGDREAFREFLAALARGASLDGAALEAYSRSMAQLEAEWFDSLRTRYLWYPIGALGALFWVVGGLLLFLGWLRRRRQNRRRLAEWAIAEAKEGPAP